ncbi:hypothetical protein PRIPAC_71998 [Pristionchus pacificus]|uniref:Uncharacterized protein n=1 Tax=Pristionchus pacificus TaxID=54126 RepID=A0A2A6BRL1_PRIPA|nr:hypothetical protein PRIPAC_71998 [Pristionchus pacificus]|eukprot:PDM68569.1 hypothetical protein PRIPAC_44071 [Pristionchus pacificus]
MQASFLLPLLLIAVVEQTSAAPYCPMPQIIKMEQYRNKNQDECLDLQEPEWYGFPTPISDDTFFDLCCKKKFCEAPHVMFFWCFIRPRVG